MGQPNIQDLGNIFYLAVPFAIYMNVIGTIFSHELLKQNYLLHIYVVLCFSAICCLTTLSHMCVIRRKDEAAKKPIWKLCDSDLDFEDGYEDFQNESNWLMRRKNQFFLFMKHKRIYGLVFEAGVLLTLMAFILKGASYYYPSMEQDLHVSSVLLAATGIFIILLVFKISGIPRPEPIKYTYKPFDADIIVPMKAFVPKVILHLTRNFIYVLSVLFYLSAAFYGVITVCKMPEEEIKRFKDATEFEHIHQVMFVIMIICNLCGIALLVENVMTAYVLAQEDLILTFEKNWRRNMVALEYFLPEREFTSLEELRNAFLEKSSRKDLTAVEKKILKYIEIPLWKSKPNFLPRRAEGNGIPKELMSDWPLDAPAENPVEETSPPPSEVVQEQVSPTSPVPSPPVTRSKTKLR